MDEDDLNVTQLGVLAQLLEMGFDRGKVTEVLLRVGTASVTRVMSALEEDESRTRGLAEEAKRKRGLPKLMEAPASATADEAAAAPSSPAPRKKAKKSAARRSTSLPSEDAPRAAPGKAARPRNPAKAARPRDARGRLVVTPELVEDPENSLLGMEVRLVDDPEVRGVCTRYWRTTDFGVSFDVVTTTGRVLLLTRKRAVEACELTAAEVEACAARKEGQALLQARVDEIVSLAAHDGSELRNEFRAKDGTVQRQLVAVDATTVRCPLRGAEWEATVAGPVDFRERDHEHAFRQFCSRIQDHCGMTRSVKLSGVDGRVGHVAAVARVSGVRLLGDGSDRQEGELPSSQRGTNTKGLDGTFEQKVTADEDGDEAPPPESLPPKKRKRGGKAARPGIVGSSRVFRQFDALRELHPDFDGTRAFPRNRTIMPTFRLRNADNAEIPNEAHEAFEQFVLCWLFNEIVPRFCHTPNACPAGDGPASPGWVGAAPSRGALRAAGVSKLRVLELGGGIGAVSTMVQQMIEMVDASAQHVVFEPNTVLADGPLAYNRDRYASKFHVVRGVLSKSEAVPFGAGDVDPDHPRAWMWGTVNGAKSRKGEKGSVPGYDLAHVRGLLGGDPTVLVADCEGGLIPVLADFPELLDAVVALYYERDPPGDYDAMESTLATKGFTKVLSASLHRVWVHAARLPPATHSSAEGRNRSESVASAVSGAPSSAPSTRSDDDARSADAARAWDARRADLAALAARAHDRVAALEDVVARGAALAAAAATAAPPPDGPALAAATRKHFDEAYGPALARARDLARIAKETADAADADGGTPRRLAVNARVVCAWHEDDWGDGEYEYYPGLVSEAKDDGTYNVLFDDEDERYDVPRADLHPVFVEGSFDWTGPFVPLAADAAAAPPPPPEA